MKDVIAYVHTHWDREWYREFEDFRIRLIEVFDEIIEMLEKGSLPCFYFDGQTAVLEDYLEIKPQNKDRIKNLIRRKKLRTGPFYCISDSFLVSGECLCKNLEMGIKKSEEFGETDFIGYLSDTFGHSRAVAYILKFFGIDKACLWRGLGSLPADLNWNGINVTYLIQGYFQNFLNLDCPIEKKAELLKIYLDKIAVKSSDVVLLPVGADHLAVSGNLAEQIEKLNEIYKKSYKIKLSDPFEYFKRVNKRKNVQGEFLNNELNFILPGVYSSRIYLKQANAVCQWKLARIAEPLQALAHFFFGSKSKQDEIDYAYKLLIKNHAHDSIYGCGIDEVHRENEERFHNVETICNSIINCVKRDLSAHGGGISVINLSDFKYSGHIKLQTGRELPKWLNAVKISSKLGFTDEKLYNINDIPVTEDITAVNEYLLDVKNIPPFSVAKITKDNLCKNNYLKSSDCSMENEFIKFEIKNNRIILTDKIKNEDYFDFIKFKDRADIGDSYNFGALKNDIPIYSILKKYRIKEQNRIRVVFGLDYDIDIPETSCENRRSKRIIKHNIEADIILYNQSRYIEFRLNWINKSRNHILQIDFNLKQKIYKTLNEDLFGTIERRFDPDFDIYAEIPALKGREIKPNTSVMQRFMSANSVSLFTKGNCEYEINSNILSLTLLRATGIISNPVNPARGTPAGPPLLTPGMQCIGKNSCSFAVSFAREEIDLFMTANEFYDPCICLFTKIQDKKLIEINNKNLLVSGISKCSGGIAVRLFNNSDKAQSADLTGSGKNTFNIEPKSIYELFISDA